jgi:hypothetical protein
VRPCGGILLRHREVMMGVRQGQMEYAVVVAFIIIRVLCFYRIAKDMPKTQLFVFNRFLNYKYISPIK